MEGIRGSSIHFFGRNLHTARIPSQIAQKLDSIRSAGQVVPKKSPFCDQEFTLDSLYEQLLALFCIAQVSYGSAKLKSLLLFSRDVQAFAALHKKAGVIQSQAHRFDVTLKTLF